MLEIETPISGTAETIAEAVAKLDSFHGVVIAENGGVDAILIAQMVRKRCDKDIFLKFSCRDRNRIALHSQLATAASLELRNVVIIDGKHTILTDFQAAKPVYELDALALVRMMRGKSLQFSDKIDDVLSTQPWNIGVEVGGATPPDRARAKRFLDGGADIFFTRVPETVSMLRKLTDRKIVLSVSQENAGDMKSLQRSADEIEADAVCVIVADLKRLLDGTIIGG